MKLLSSFEFGDVSAIRWDRVQRCWAVFGLLLFSATWRLWIPQNVFPQVPLIRVAGLMPVACQWLALAVVAVSLVLVLVISARLTAWVRAWLYLLFVGSLALLILVDQHRLQPWAYQLLIYAAVFGTLQQGAANRARGLALLRILAISIYLFSALGKLDYQFLHSVGQQFLGVLFGTVGVEVVGWPWPVRLLLAATFPLAELVIVIFLTVPRLRRIGISAAICMHLLLLAVLGPLGLQHRPGVLIWNAFFIAQVLLLFSGSATRDIASGEAATREQSASRRWVPTGVVAAAVCLPLLEPFGWYDHWPSWGLYSPRNSRAIVEVHRAGIADLPEDLRGYLTNNEGSANWVALNIDQWSLAVLAVPIYPQDRFQLGVADSIATRYRLERTIRVRLLGMSNRWSGTRIETMLTGRPQIVAAASRFRLNARANEPD